MRWNLEELRRKEVIDLHTGEKLGYIDDVELDTDSCTVRGYVIRGRRYFGGLLCREKDLFIPCGSIRLYGKDVLLTENAESIGQHEQKTIANKYKFRHKDE